MIELFIIFPISARDFACHDGDGLYYTTASSELRFDPNECVDSYRIQNFDLAVKGSGKYTCIAKANNWPMEMRATDPDFPDKKFSRIVNERPNLGRGNTIETAIDNAVKFCEKNKSHYDSKCSVASTYNSEGEVYPPSSCRLDRSSEKNVKFYGYKKHEGQGRDFLIYEKRTSSKELFSCKLHLPTGAPANAVGIAGNIVEAEYLAIKACHDLYGDGISWDNLSDYMCVSAGMICMPADKRDPLDLGRYGYVISNFQTPKIDESSQKVFIKYEKQFSSK